MVNRSTEAEGRDRSRSSRITHDLILCTKDRPSDATQCLIKVLSSSVLPQNLIVVDSSADDRTSAVVDSMKEDFAQADCDVVYVRSKPGLPAQRNLGLDLASSDVAHFIDDDSFVDSEYFCEILKPFRRFGTKIAGVGGMQSNVVTLQSSFVRRLFLLAGASGQITRAARNSFVTSQTTDLTPAGWLSGCAMSYWTALARRERFDEGLEGYALGEDLEFSSRMAGHGLLLVQPSAKVLHKLSEHNRLSSRRLTCDDIVNRWHFVRKDDPRFSRVAYVWSVVGLISIALAKVLLGRFDEGITELLGIRDGLILLRPLSFAVSDSSDNSHGITEGEPLE